MRIGVHLGIPWQSIASEDQPSLDLAFALDKTLTARKGPTPTFTRVSGATQVNASGLIEYAPENLLLRSDDFGNATWQKFLASVTTNTAASPSGVTDADTLIETATTGQHYTFQQIAKETGSVTYCFSVYYKNAIGTRNLMLALTNGTSSGKAVIFTTSGAITATNLNVGSGAGFTFISANVDTLSGGWYRASIVIASDSANRLDAVAYLNTSATSVSSYAGDGVSGIYLWGAQLERNAVARTYNPTTASQFYAPRFDHDPVTLACKGLLIEGEGRNLLPRSNELNVTPWVPATVTRSQVIGAGLDGGPAWLLVPTGTDSSLGQTHTVASSVPHTFSVYLKSDTGANVSISLSVYDNTAGINRGVKPITITPQWQRFDITTSTVVAGNSTAFLIGAFGSWTTGENILAWGAQLEAGSFPTSYIPTTTTALTRSADVCSITGSNFSGMWQSATAATILLEANASAMTASTSGNRGIATLSNGAAYSNQIGFYKESGTNFIRGRTPTGNLIQVSNLLGKFKGAIAIDSSTAGCFNGGTVITGSDNIGTVDRLSFADATLSPAGHPSVWISRYQIYRKRLPNAKLQSLTTP